MRLFLASLSLASLPSFLGPDLVRGMRVAWIPAAADPLEDAARVRALFGAMLDELGLSPLVCELGDGEGVRLAARLAACDAVVVTGGDPFHLLARCRASGLDEVLARAVRDGMPYVGVSAGAIVAGPSLEPHFATSPFVPPRGLALEGLALTDRVVLPHDDRPDRAPLHGLAREQFGARFAIETLADDEALIVDGGVVRRVRA